MPPFVMKEDGQALTREREGVWVDYMEGQLLIARIGNPHNLKVFAKHRQPYKRQLLRGTVAQDVQAKIVCKTYAESVLLGWRGIKDDEGNELKYTTELAEQVLLNDIDLREFVESVGQESATFREEEIKETAKK